MEEETKLTGRGGAGRGQGRKSKGGEDGTRHVGFRCSPDVYNILQMQPDKTKYIEDAIREKHRRERW